MNCTICKQPINLKERYFVIPEIDRDDELHFWAGSSVHWGCFYSLNQSHNVLNAIYDKYIYFTKNHITLLVLHMDSRYCISVFNGDIITIKIKILGQAFECTFKECWFEDFEKQLKGLSSYIPAKIQKQTQVIVKEIKEKLESYNKAIEEEKRAIEKREFKERYPFTCESLKQVGPLSGQDLLEDCPFCNKKIAENDYYFQLDADQADAKYSLFYNKKIHWHCLFNQKLSDNFLDDLYKKRVNVIKKDDENRIVVLTDDFYIILKDIKLVLFIAEAAIEITCYPDEWIENITYGVESYYPFLPADKIELVKRILDKINLDMKELDKRIDCFIEKENIKLLQGIKNDSLEVDNESLINAVKYVLLNKKNDK